MSEISITIDNAADRLPAISPKPAPAENEKVEPAAVKDLAAIQSVQVPGPLDKEIQVVDSSEAKFKFLPHLKNKVYGVRGNFIDMSTSHPDVPVDATI